METSLNISCATKVKLELRIYARRGGILTAQSNSQNKDEYEHLVKTMSASYEASYSAYIELLGNGPVPNYDRGLARDILPVGIYSSCWVTCNPRSLMAFLSLRTHEPTATAVSYPLWEIEIAARAAEQILADGWPITYQAWLDNGRVAP